MGQYLRLRGSKEKITDELLDKMDSPDREIIYSGTEFKEYISCFLDVLEINYKILLDDEDFEKIGQSDYTENKGFITQDANYYINLKGGTLAVVAILADYVFRTRIGLVAGSAMGFTTYSMAKKLLAKHYPELSLSLYHKLDAALGESCIMLEAARRGRKGIDQAVFAKNRGECVNNHLWCRFWAEGKCTCTKEDVKDICTELEKAGLLIKRKSKYYYQDIF